MNNLPAFKTLLDCFNLSSEAWLTVNEHTIHVGCFMQELAMLLFNVYVIVKC